MPELPEVETTRRGLAPHLVGRRLVGAEVRQAALRLPIPSDLRERLMNQRLAALSRRGKYLLFHFDRATLIAHLGMSGSLRIVAPHEAPRPHDHVDLSFEGGLRLRYRDPRRFGCLLTTEDDPLTHPLLRDLGPEPLSGDFDGAVLYRSSRGRKVAVKNLIMDSHVVVGVGNIYANEALFDAGIRPTRAASAISAARYDRLAASIRAILTRAIESGGSTLRDYVNGHGQPGYFQLTLYVYQRAGEACPRCGATILTERIGQRSTFFCPRCQR